MCDTLRHPLKNFYPGGHIDAVPKILREKLTDAGVEALIQIIDRVEEQSQKVVFEMAEERFEKRVAQTESRLESKITELKSDLEIKISHTKSELKADIGAVRTELKADIGAVRSELKTDIGAVKSDLEVKIAQTESRLIRWMFVFWVGQFASIVGTLTAILFAFFKP